MRIQRVVVVLEPWFFRGHIPGEAETMEFRVSVDVNGRERRTYQRVVEVNDVESLLSRLLDVAEEQIRKSLKEESMRDKETKVP